MTYLDLRANPLGPAGVRELLSGEGLPSLKELDLGGCGLDNGDLAWVIDLPLLGRLGSLALVRTSYYAGEKRDDRLGGDAFLQFQRDAYSRGCSVNLYQPPKGGGLRSIVAPDSGPLPLDERRLLASYLSTFRFQEYTRCGWFKVAAVSDLASYVHAPASRRALAAYQAGDRSDTTFEGVIHLFSGWMASEVPESICGWDIERKLPMESITRPEAMALAGQIAKESEKAELRGIRPAFAPRKPKKSQRLPYASLPGWFDQVLADDALFYRSGGPAVLGLDAEHIAVFWLE